MSQSDLFQLHGYFPVVIDERILTQAERTEAFLGSLTPEYRKNKHSELPNYLNPEERRQLDELRAQANVPKKRGRPKLLSDYTMQIGDLLRLAALREYARRKYAGGKAYWLSDRPIGLP